MAILNLTVKESTNRESVSDYLREMSLYSSMQRQIDYTESSEVVSSDFVGNRHAGIIDSHATIVNGHQMVLYVWYDNEFGYTKQVIRIAKYVTKVRRLIYY